MLELLPGLVCSFDTDLRYIYSNDAYARLRGHDRHQILGQHYSEVVGPINAVAIRASLEKALAGTPTDFEYDIIAVDGKRRVLAHYRPDFAPDGTVRGVHAFITDLTSVSHAHLLDIEKEALFEDAFRNAPIGMALVDTMGVIIRANESFAGMLGRRIGEVANLPFADITHPEDLHADNYQFGEVLRGASNGYRLDKRYIHVDGSIVEVVLSVSAMRNAAGEIVCFISHTLDVTEQRKAARALQASNAQLSLAMEVVRGGFWHLDIAAARFETSKQLAQFVEGPDRDSLDFDGYVAHIPEQDLAGADLNSLIEGSLDRSVAQYRLETSHGIRWMRCDRRLIRDAAGRPSTVVGVVTDITEEHEQLERTRAQADTDSLTSLFNRRGLQHRVEASIAGRPWVAMTVDLDGFKQVNDVYGHAAGDHVLIETAGRMLGAVRDGDLVGRLGGDEFVIILPGADRTMLEAIASRMVEAVNLPIPFGSHPLRVSCSIGATAMDGSHADLAEALKEADAALYQAKASGKNTWRVF